MTRRFVAYVGSYAEGIGNGAGGIDVLELAADGTSLTPVQHLAEPTQAGYLLHSPSRETLYAVDERKTDGRGPVGTAAAVHALRIDPRDGRLTPIGVHPTFGPFPTHLDLAESDSLLFSANHGGFDHVERVVPGPDGTWSLEYQYDDSTVVAYALEPDGRIRDVVDVQLFTEHGLDPNSSPQAGGHGQASGHAHCAVVDPAERHVLVCDKSTDRITVLEVGVPLRTVATYQFPTETGPRHLVFSPDGSVVYVTCEFSSTAASLAYDPSATGLTLLDEVRTTADGFAGHNEPADVRVHPGGGVLVVNNRGEDTAAWFAVAPDGRLQRRGAVGLAPSEHPGLAARSLAFSPDGSVLLVADRPAHLVRSFAVDPIDGTLTPVASASITDPAFVTIVEVDS